MTASVLADPELVTWTEDLPELPPEPGVQTVVGRRTRGQVLADPAWRFHPAGAQLLAQCYALSTRPQNRRDRRERARQVPRAIRRLRTQSRPTEPGQPWYPLHPWQRARA